MSKPVTDFPKTSRPAEQALIAAGFTRMEQLNGRCEAELLKLHGMGPKAMGILKQSLEERGMSLAP